MLILVLIFGFLLYGALYYAWAINQAAFYQQPFSVHTTITDMMWMPQNEVFLILRGLLLIAVFYLVADFLITSARNGVKKRKMENAESQRHAAPAPQRQEIDIDAF